MPGFGADRWIRMPMSSMERTSGHAGNENLTVAQIDALRNINNALDSLGGPGAACPVAVSGTLSAARHQSGNERRLDFATARGIIIAALETLATCYGYIGMDKKRRL